MAYQQAGYNGPGQPGWQPDGPALAGPGPVRPVSRWVTGAGAALATLLAVNAVASVIGARWAWLARHAYEQADDRSAASAVAAAEQRFEPTMHVLSSVTVITFGLAALVWIAWLHGMHGNLRAFPALGLPRHAQGWAIGGWFVPLLNLVRPKQMMDDAWRGSDPTLNRPGARHPVDVPWYFHLWWMSCLLVCLSLMSGNGGQGTDLSGRINTAYDLIQDDLFIAVAAALAFVVVVTLTRRHRRWLALRAPRSR
jgi:hypothetical protein